MQSLKAHFCACAAVSIALAAPPASAVMGTIDVTPAATLLFPYFEVTLDDPNGPTTLLSIINSSSAPVTVQATLWTDMAVPTTAVHYVLAARSVRSLNVRDLLLQASEGVRAAHLGQPSSLFGGQCAGMDLGDLVARGYVTVDVMRAPPIDPIDPIYPGDPGYFGAGGTGLATNDNVLTGDFVLVDPANNFAQGDAAVHVEADSAYGGVPGVYTFYGRELGGSGEDNREALPTIVAAGYLNGLTTFVAWRDTGVPGESFPCGAAPAWFPQGQAQNVEFDTETNPQVPVPGDVIPVPFPLAVTRVVAGSPGYPIEVGKSGWVYLDLNSSSDLPGAPFGRARQAWVWAITEDEGLGRFSHSSPGLQLDNAGESRAPIRKAPGTGGGR